MNSRLLKVSILLAGLECVACKNRGQTWRVQSGEGYSKSNNQLLTNSMINVLYQNCLSVSDIPWYAWLVLSIKILMLLAVIGFGIYMLIKYLRNRKKKNCYICFEQKIDVPEPWELHRKKCFSKHDFRFQEMQEHSRTKCPKCDGALREIVG